MYQQISRCRICGNSDLAPILHLGVQALTGIFPHSADARVSEGPLDLVRCNAHSDKNRCGLVQLRHSFDLGEMYGANYGYRSSLNRSMVEHLRQKVGRLREIVKPGKGALAIDIGSNDGTLLSFHPQGDATLVGIDPTSGKFRQHYRSDIRVITDFFSAAAVQRQFGQRKADIITAIAMFYDLEDPQSFVNQIASILSPQGIFHFEQSYLPAMLNATAYDTICHEHIEYYSLRQIKWLADRAGLKIIDVETNDVNGGSFAITAAHANSSHPRSPRVAHAFAEEAKMNLENPATYESFVERVRKHKGELVALVEKLQSQGRKILGYGASTKGNVILQYCGFTPNVISHIAEVNPDKFGCFTPGTRIPIISEADAKAMKPDYLLVFPWHFRQNLLARETEFLSGGGKMIFPLPQIEVVPA